MCYTFLVMKIDLKKDFETNKIKNKKINKEFVVHKLKHNQERYGSFVKWVLFGIVMGAICGVLGFAFHTAISFVTTQRILHPVLLAGLPVGALLIAGLYHIMDYDHDGGTNMVLLSIQADEDIPLRMAPLIFISTILSHLFGASVGREGAALQLGGSIGNAMGKLFRFSETNKKTMIMTGMSGVFAALFGTPIAAAVFPLEVVSVGIMHYAALVPCVVSSILARRIAELLGAPAPFYDLGVIPKLSLRSTLLVMLLAVCCGFLSMFFCICLHQGEHLFSQKLPNKYGKALLLGTAILLLTIHTGDQTYNGAGTDYIIACVEGRERPLGYLVKILFTVLSLSAGYKGGEIVPSFFIGASFGCLFGNLAGFSPALCAGIGMGAVFCGVTNCPISSLLICCELFGFDGAPFFLIATSFSYMISGYYGLYTSQKIVYSKFKSNYIDKKTQ